MVSKLAGELNGTKIMSTSQNSTHGKDLADIMVRQSDETIKYVGFYNLVRFGCASLSKQSAYLPSVVQLQNGILLMIESQPLKLMKMQSVANDCKLVGASVAHSVPP